MNKKKFIQKQLILEVFFDWRTELIFVTVGTHEQQFDRLIKKIDELNLLNVIKEDVIIQRGYCSYKPTSCFYRDFFSYQEMKDNIEKARIIVTHGGPASFLSALQIGKVPIVVPRQLCFGEHINNQQLEFSRLVFKRFNNILLVEDVGKLGVFIENYDEIVRTLNSSLNSNNRNFCENLKRIVDSLIL